MSDKRRNSRPFRILHRPVSVTPITKLSLLHFALFVYCEVGWALTLSLPYDIVWCLRRSVFCLPPRRHRTSRSHPCCWWMLRKKPCIRKCSFLAHVTRLRDIFWNRLHQQCRFLGRERFKTTYLLPCWDARHLGVFSARFVKSWW